MCRSLFAAAAAAFVVIAGSFSSAGDNHAVQQNLLRCLQSILRDANNTHKKQLPPAPSAGAPP
jgi:hypothetical protein